MEPQIETLGEETLVKAWGELKRAEFRMPRRDGSWVTLKREYYGHGNAAAILIANPQAGTVLLTRQFRYAPVVNGDSGWLLEVCAGVLDGDDPQVCAEREAQEEVGHRVKNVRPVMTTYVSPGSFTEKVNLFVGEYDDTTRVSAGGGLAEEGEDIEVVELPFNEALAMIESGAINDAKTILLLQWAALNRLFPR